ncbi:MAG: UDP-N-acetylmuramoyl-L-alanine--D-glutamate ligase [bacterium]
MKNKKNKNQKSTIKKIAILGYGAEGKAVKRFIKKKYPHASIEIRDQKISKDYLESLDRFDVIYRSPGIPYLTSEIQTAKKKGVLISSSTKLFFKHAPGTIIGITGTKGKGTTSTLLYKILKAGGKDAYLGGNVGTPAISILPKINKNSITILELSSFQLQDCESSPSISVLLEIFPDHMDSHKTYKEYVQSKNTIAQFQRKKDVLFYSPHNKESCGIAKNSQAKKISIALKDNTNLLNKIVHVIKIPGHHNLKNALAATLVAHYLKIPETIIFETIKKYRGMPYRIQYITTINGIKIYNDSASTNPMTTAAVVRSFQDPTIILAGGKDKNLDYTPLTKALSEKNSVTLIILFGEDREKIAKSIPAHIPTIITKTLESAFQKALSKAQKGYTIILSPGATSLDQFSNYKERGKRFSSIAKAAKNKYTCL